jgi:ATP-dependent exoDNAse (exonuclease V) beta subunit
MPEQQTIVVQGISIAEITPAAGPKFTAEQRAAIEARDPLVVLSAGAGSGKTSVLVERFVALVDEGVSPQEILAITFTEKAAAEMKERIVERFEQRGDETNRRRTEAAYISTIHGLCARLLRENPFAARLDPSFGIIDGLSRGLFLEEQKRTSMTDEWFLDQCDRLPRTWGSDEPTIWLLVRDAALKAREFGTDQAEEAGFDVEQHVRQALARVEEGVRIRWRAARAQLLAIAPTTDGASVSGPKRQADHRRMCESADGT